MTSFDAICQMVELGAGVAIVPEKAARRREEEAIAIVSLSDEWATRRLLICCRQFTALTAHAKRLIEHLTAWDRR